nr:MAG TPA: hypothetical protein [Caudoviricetes sp.]
MIDFCFVSTLCYGTPFILTFPIASYFKGS